jgi:hypothetical protein
VIKNFLLKDDQLFSRHIFSRAAGDVIGKKGIVTLSRRIESAETAHSPRFFLAIPIFGSSPAGGTRCQIPDNLPLPKPGQINTGSSTHTL